jgi:hypothetical protein
VLKRKADEVGWRDAERWSGARLALGIGEHEFMVVSTLPTA